MSTDAVIIIHNLNLRLPLGFEKRAASIARNIGRELGYLDIHLQDDQQLANLDIGALQVAGGETNHVIARRIATAIVKQLHSLQATVTTIPTTRNNTHIICDQGINPVDAGVTRHVE